MKIETREYTTDESRYRYTVIAATTDEGKDIAFEMIVYRTELDKRYDRKHPHYSVTDECIADFGLDEINALRKYHDDGTVHIYGI